MSIDHYKKFDVEYDRKVLSDLFYEYIYDFPAEQNLRSPFKALSDNIDLTSHEVVSALFDTVPAIPKTGTIACRVTALCEITKPVHMHCNPKNNGVIFFPISGSLEVSFFSHNPPLDENGRPTFSPIPDERPKLTDEEKQAIENTLIEKVILDKPMAINGLKLYSYQPVSLEPPLVFVLKIPLEVNWLDVITSISK
jgi:hypothetical protein